MHFLKLMALITFVNICYIAAESFDLKKKELQVCFEQCWSIDPHTSALICNYFSCDQGCLIVDDFIDKSAKLNIQFPIDKKINCLHPHDGVIQASKFHPVIFESPYVRIMLGCAEPGEREPFHTHTWKSLLVVFERASYYVEYANGSNELLHLEPGVYELPPEELYACTNLGTTKENCLRFEVKD